VDENRHRMLLQAKGASGMILVKRTGILRHRPWLKWEIHLGNISKVDRKRRGWLEKHAEGKLAGFQADARPGPAQPSVKSRSDPPLDALRHA